MCGIAGVYGEPDRDTLSEMLDCIRHRGPDEEATYVAPDAPLSMGARRLAIVDLEGGSQPKTNEEGTVSVVFNGEIYNHETLRERLTAEGHAFESACDTEVLVHLWEEYGSSMPEHLDGMFAFSLWDDETETLFLARDRLGIKPLYYADEPERFVWGSELPALLAADVDRRLDERAVRNYFALRYTPWPETLLDSVRKLPPGCSLTVTDEGVRTDRYWRLEPAETTCSRSEATRRVRSQLEEAVERRLMADVPLGAFLSGGLDSSAIVGLADRATDEPVETFSVGFRGAAYDESDEARFVADHFGTNHHETTVDLSSMDVFGDVVRHFGEPLADPATLPTTILSAYASDHVTVALTGEGADELFAGYDYFHTLRRHREWFGDLPSPVYDAASLASDVAPVGDDYFRYFAALESDEQTLTNWLRGYGGAAPESYLHGEGESGFRGDGKDASDRPPGDSLDGVVAASMAPDGDTLQRLSSYYIRHWLSDDLLYKVDHASMAASLEARVPFLDHSLVEFLHGLPSEYKTQGGDYKPLLGAAVRDVVPQRVRSRSKHGFDVPVARWFRDDHEAIARWLTEERVSATPYLDAPSVFELWAAHRRGDANYDDELWRILNYVAWYHEHVAR